MGANTYEKQNYWTIVSGKLWTKLDKNHPQATKREYTDKQNQKHEYWGKFADSWTGLICDINRREGSFGVELQILMRDEKEDCVISVKFNSAFATDFMCRALNPEFDTLESTEVIPFTFENDEKKTKSYLILKQKAKKILSPFSKENPLPPWKQVKVKGELVWDNTETLEFLYDRAKALFSGGDLAKPSGAALATKPEPVDVFDDTFDDLPF